MANCTVSIATLCPDCGAERRVFSSSGRVSKHCQKCRKIVKTTIACVDCGEPIPPPDGSGKQSIRCVTCRAEFRRSRARETGLAVRQLKCKKCRKPCGRNEFCSDECRDGHCTKACEVCGAQFSVASNGTPKATCSMECASKARLKTKGISAFRRCNGCGVTFKRRRSGKSGMFCSRECAFSNTDKWNRFNNQNPAVAVKIMDAGTTAVALAPDNAVIRKQRILRQTVEKVDRLKVFARDRFHCWICLAMCKRTGDRVNDPLEATLDHAVPISKGGVHSYDNSRTAHRVCNGMKGSKD